MKIVCFGDSITQGQVSYNWVKELQRSRKADTIYNKGVNGELAWHLLQRVDEVIALQPDVVFILVGTNDIFSTLSEALTKRYVRNGKLPQIPDKDWYRKNLTAIVEQLQQKTKAKIALISIPMLGEKLAEKGNEKVRLYNAVVKGIAQEKGCAYLDLYFRMEAYHKNNPPSQNHPIENSISLVVKAVLKRKLLFYPWNKVSKSFGLTLTTDNLHLNETSGQLLLKLVTDWLNKSA